jgi:hypothetical protein
MRDTTLRRSVGFVEFYPRILQVKWIVMLKIPPSVIYVTKPLIYIPKRRNVIIVKYGILQQRNISPNLKPVDLVFTIIVKPVIEVKIKDIGVIPVIKRKNMNKRNIG